MKLSREKRSLRAEKGSQFHLQNIINKNQYLLDEQILEVTRTLKDQIGGVIKWVSPLAKENYLEYQDEEFLEAIGYSQLKNKLSEFWPAGGPVWDALAIFPLKNDSRNGVIILEAKSHVKELKSRGCHAEGKSREIIINTFQNIQKALGVPSNFNWLGEYYQYANRLAHLYFLVTQNIPTWLVFLYFVGDKEQNGPIQKEGWQEAITAIKERLGISKEHSLSSYIVNVFFKL